MPPKTRSRAKASKNTVEDTERKEEIGLKHLLQSLRSFLDLWKKIQKDFHSYVHESENTFFDLINGSSMKDNCKHFMELSTRFDRKQLTLLEELYNLFIAQDVSIVISLCNQDKSFRDMFLEAGQHLVAGCLLNGDVYPALKVMFRMLKVECSYTSVLICIAMYIALEIGDGAVYAQLKEMSLTQTTESLRKWLSSMDFWYKSLETEKYSAALVRELQRELLMIEKDTCLTFFTSYAKICLRHGLINESKKAMADITKTADTLMNLHRVYDFSYGCVCAIFPGSPDGVGFVDLFQKREDSRAFYIIENAFYAHAFMEASYDLQIGMIDAGLMREAESRGIVNISLAFSTCSPYRVYKSLNLFYWTKWRVTTDRQHLGYILEWYKGIRMPQNMAAKRIMILEEEELASDMDDMKLDNRSASQKYSYLPRPALEPEPHPARCRCLFCGLRPNQAKSTCSALRVERHIARFLCIGVLKMDFEQFLSMFESSLDILRKERNKLEEEFPHASNPAFVQLKIMRVPLYLLIDFLKSSNGLNLPVDRRRSVISRVLKEFGLSPSNKTVLKSLHLMFNHIRRPKPPPFDFSWIKTPGFNERSHLTDKVFDQNGDIFEAYSEMKEYRHLLYREWRFEVSTYLAANCECLLKALRAAHVALYFTESVSIAVRASIRRKLHRKLEYENMKRDTVEQYDAYPLCFIDDSTDVMTRHRSIPDDTTIIQLVFDSHDILWLIRYNSNQEEIFSIPLRHVPAAGSLEVSPEDADPCLAGIREVLLQSDQSTRTTKDGKEFWKIRMELETRFQALMFQLEKSWFGSISPLLRPLSRQSATHPTFQRAMADLMGYRFSQTVSMLLVLGIIHSKNETAFLTLANIVIERISSFTSKVPRDMGILRKIYKKHCQRFQQVIFDFKEEDSFLFLAVPGSISFVPWEAFSVFNDVLVSRITSLQIFDILKARHKKLPTPVDLRNSYYVLNPGGDLKKTEERFKHILMSSAWNGMTGTAPPKGTVLTSLENNDMYFYVGHGNGLKYIGSSSEVQKSECKATCLLMGCSSVEIVDEGRGYDGRAVLNELIVSRCPCVVGCLYMVTDGEIDSVFMEILRYLNQEWDNSCRNNESERHRLLLRAVIQARKCCRLKLLTGHAVVCYGIPTATINPDPQIALNMLESSAMAGVMNAADARYISKMPIDNLF